MTMCPKGAPCVALVEVSERVMPARVLFFQSDVNQVKACLGQCYFSHTKLHPGLDFDPVHSMFHVLM